MAACEMKIDDLSTGLELILNASEGVLQIAITQNEKLICFEEWLIQQKGAEILSDAITEICKRLNFIPKDLKRIACVTGPGSFTGIRLVLATSAALRRVSKAQLANINYLQALATSAVIWRGLLYPEKVFVLTHARKNLVHFQQFQSYGPQIPALSVTEIEVITPEDALAKIGNQSCLVCGSALIRYPQTFALPSTGKGPIGAPNAIILNNLANPISQALCLLARHGDYFPRDLEPNYIRQCDAVENLSKDDEVFTKVIEILDKVPKSQI